MDDQAYFNVCVQLLRVRDAILLLRERELIKYGISQREAAALHYIHCINESGQEATPSEVARQMFRKPNSVFGILRRMEKRGLITLSNDLKRKNMVRITPTDIGIKAYNSSLNRETYREIMGVLSPDELQTFSSLLDKLRNRAFAKIGNGTPLPYYTDTERGIVQ